jgi:hypothetical protein
VSFAKFLFLPSWFVKLLETNFSCFAKIIWMPSWFAKLLELLLRCDFCKNYGKSMSKNIYIFLKNVVLMLLKCIGKNERRSSPRVPNNLKYRR